MLSNRRKQQLIMEGIDPEKIESNVRFLYQIIIDRDLSLKEAEIVVGNLDCIIREMGKRNPDTLLCSIPDLEDRN